MKATIFSMAIFLIPFCSFSQEIDFAENLLSHKDSDTAEQEDFYLITPILLRDSSTMNYQDQNGVDTQNAFFPFASSLIIPGTGQLQNRTWWKAGIFMAVEATSVFLFFDYRNRAKSGERKFENWSDENWSVVQYSNWLVDYHDVNGLNNPHLNDLRSSLKGEEATFNTSRDWQIVDLEQLRNVERNTPYVTSDQQATNNFSHTMPDYGSQQYYELISKYYQYQAGWRDYHDFHNNLGHSNDKRFLIDRNGEFASPYFFHGAALADEFNTDFRRSGYFISILIANHIISAFDAYFTLKLKQNRLQATSSAMPGRQLKLTYRF